VRYRDAAAFRQALEQRLNARAAGDGARLARDRKRVAFDRLLARLNVAASDRWLLKGGFALDLRLAERARATRDVDIEWQTAEEELLDALIDATSVDVGDYFAIQVERTATPPDRLGGSHRFRVRAALAGRPFETFLLDVGLRSDPINEYDTLTTPDLLAFAEIEPAHIRAIPLERHIAEKLHAYTRRYGDDQPSSRAKDLIDLVLMSELAPFEFSRLREVIVRLVETRDTHELPASVPAPPSGWARPYRALAEEVGLDPDLAVGHRLVAAFLDPVLASEPGLAHWDAEALGWRRS
jgi:predicted nucleotidyltransferase component of viral defense system